MGEGQDLLGIIECRTPVPERGGGRSKMGRYIFRDNFLRFYAHYICRNGSLYQAGRYEKLMHLNKRRVEGLLRVCI